MIGIFGLRRSDPAMPADLSPFRPTVPDRYGVHAPQGHGGSLGVAAHAAGFPAGRAGNDAAGTTVVVTGAIFNVSDLARERSDITDAAGLILHLYEGGQLQRLAEANGQFAAAVYDKRNHRLVLITDRIGTTPILVWKQGGEVIFATQLYTLLGDRRIARTPDTAATAQLFTMQRTFGETTPVAGVVALPAACIATFDGSGEKRQIYWRLEWRPAGFSEDEGAAMLAKALQRAVARQSIGRRNGLLLSGGVDSRMVLAAAQRSSLSCWTTASYDDNPELALAKQVSAMFGAEHHTLIVNPADTLAVHDDTVVESGGAYPASNPMSAFLPRVGENCDVILTGHGLDYTLRGYYLPTSFIAIGSSKTRLPRLRPIPARPTGKDVLATLRQGPPRSTVEQILRPDAAPAWWSEQAQRLDRVLEPWLRSADPYNAWDAFILHSVNKHYAFTGMMSVRAVGDLAIPAFDNEVMQVYLGMRPADRVSGRIVHKAIRMLAPEAAALPNANTNFRADMNPWAEVAALFARAGLRRLGLAGKPKPPSPSHSVGSWQDLNGLYRHDPGHRQRFLDIRKRLDGLTCGVLSADGLAACIDEHLDGRQQHAKLLRQLLMHDAWVRRFGIEAHA